MGFDPSAIVKTVVGLISPEFRDILGEYIGKLEEKAGETPSPWDNILVAILKIITGF